MDTSSIDKSWEDLLDQLQALVGKRPSDLNAVLFLIGVQELGSGPKRFSKEAKQDLMHVAMCRVLGEAGYYAFDGYDKDGWPHWKLAKPIPSGSLSIQENFIKQHIIHYFKTVLI